MLVCISTGVNVRYLLVYVDLKKVQVGVLGKTSPVLAECTVLRPEKVPNRLSATTIAHRSAAQYGQYSAPMYSTSGLPPDVSGVPPLIAIGRPDTPLPAPTALRVLAGTLVVSVTTLASAVPVGPLLTPAAVAPAWSSP